MSTRSFSTADREEIARLTAKLAEALRLLNMLDNGDARHPDVAAFLDGQGVVPPEPAGCTGVAASWCPVHGDCTCPRDTEGRFREAKRCPLHGAQSTHAEAAPPEPRKPVDFEESWGVGAELNTPEARALLGLGDSEPRKPVAGWEYSADGDFARLSTPLGALEVGSDGMFVYPSGKGASSIVDLAPEETLEAAQLAAEDALFEIADAIDALRGGR